MAHLTKSSITRSTRPSDLPDFDNPPLVEVVLGVQFAELTGYRTQHAGLLWDQHFRSDFPRCVEQPPINTVFETFGAAIPGPPSLKVQLVQASGAPVPRLWFMKDDNTELVQVQSDRFLHNWRRKEKAPYPRYEPIREHFLDELGKVESFIKDQEIGTIEPNQCEVAYINHISLPDDSDPTTQFDRVFGFLRPLGSLPLGGGSRLPTSETTSFSLTFVIDAPESAEPLGRLHIQAQLAISAESQRIIRLGLTARGAPKTPANEGVADFLDVGRDAIVRAFAAITTPEMHKFWERLQ